jgi:hypothetical protein
VILNAADHLLNGSVICGLQISKNCPIAVAFGSLRRPDEISGQADPIP